MRNAVQSPHPHPTWDSRRSPCPASGPGAQSSLPLEWPRPLGPAARPASVPGPVPWSLGQLSLVLASSFCEAECRSAVACSRRGSPEAAAFPSAEELRLPPAPHGLAENLLRAWQPRPGVGRPLPPAGGPVQRQPVAPDLLTGTDLPSSLQRQALRSLQGRAGALAPPREGHSPRPRQGTQAGRGRQTGRCWVLRGRKPQPARRPSGAEGRRGLRTELTRVLGRALSLAVAVTRQGRPLPCLTASMSVSSPLRRCQAPA